MESLNNWASPVAQRVKNLPAMQETWVQSLVWEDPRRRKWQPTPPLLPGKFHGWRSLVGYSPWDRKESDMTEHLHWLNNRVFSLCVCVCVCVCVSNLALVNERKETRGITLGAGSSRSPAPALSAPRPGGPPNCLDQERPPPWKTAWGGHFQCAFHCQLCNEQPVPTTRAMTARLDLASRERTVKA